MRKNFIYGTSPELKEFQRFARKLDRDMDVKGNRARAKQHKEFMREKKAARLIPSRENTWLVSIPGVGNSFYLEKSEAEKFLTDKGLRFWKVKSDPIPNLDPDRVIELWVSRK